ncbi:MAG: hypothetical protein NZ846_11530 [Thermus sp.]|uniref:hypothetical protein n=1 Tax=Thermus sp. TaxID=275 RepID=UPI0025D4F7E6|nr:hypothetical protein [Thermus sp.]MCS7219576.1 hypothetical protein [Thermus sp.]
MWVVSVLFILLGAFLGVRAFTRKPRGFVGMLGRVGLFLTGGFSLLLGLALMPVWNTPTTPSSPPAQEGQAKQGAKEAEAPTAREARSEPEADKAKEEPSQASPPPKEQARGEAQAEAKPEPSEPSEPPPPPTLPELAWVDITLNLERLGFEFRLTQSTTLPGVWYRRAVKKDPDTGAEMLVEIMSYGDRVIMYEASVTGVSRANHTASWLLPYLATAPFAGNPQEASKRWVQENLTKLRPQKPLQRGVGNVRFELFGNPPFSYTLEVKPANLESWLSQALR